MSNEFGTDLLTYDVNTFNKFCGGKNTSDAAVMKHWTSQFEGRRQAAGVAVYLASASAMYTVAGLLIIFHLPTSGRETHLILNTQSEKKK